MESKFTKKSIALIAGGAVVLAGTGIGVFALASADGEGPTPGATPVPVPVEPSERPESVADSTDILSEEALGLLPSTAQYAEGASSQLGDVISYSYPGGEESTVEYAFPAELVAPTTWVVDKYVQGAIMNPYFVTDWWGTKDSLALSGPQSHFYPYLSDELKAEFTEKVEAHGDGDEEATSWLSSRVFIPGDLEIRPECYEAWDAGLCWANNESAGEVTAASATFTSQTSVEVKATVVTDVQYLHPGYEDGSIASQKRTYELTFTVEFATAPTSENLEDTKTPYMKITALDSTTSTSEAEDYLIFGELPPAP